MLASTAITHALSGTLRSCGMLQSKSGRHANQERASEMNVEEIRDELDARISGLIDDLVSKRMSELSSRESNELEGLIANSDAVRLAINKHFDGSVATQVGNRLRCGIYDGTAVDRLFDRIWTEQFDRAIEDRIRSRVVKAIDTIVDQKLRNLKST
jgi:hypothetical protein